MENPNLRAAIYVRVSTLDQNTDLQRTELVEYSQRRGWSLSFIYDETGSGTTDQRQQPQALMINARKRKFDVVIVWKMDRLFRSLRHLVATLQEFHELGIQFVSLKDHVDLTTAAGRLMAHLLASFAEFEADLIRMRVKAGIANARKKGRRIGRPPVISYAEALKMRRAGRSLREIAKALGCTKSAVSKILRKSQFELPGSTEASRSTFPVSKTEDLETYLAPVGRLKKPPHRI